MRIKDEIQEFILDRFTWLSTSVSLSLPVLLSLLTNIQNKPSILLLGIYLFIGLFIFINSIYILVARKTKPDILIVRSLDNIKNDEIDGKATAKYPNLQPHAQKSLFFSVFFLLMAFFIPNFRIDHQPEISEIISTPTATPTQPIPTPTITVIYKSPVEMNLQPGDIPGLNLTYVENPSAEPFIPNATDLSQLAYTNETSSNYIETNVLITSAQIDRTPSELFDLTVNNRRPNMVKASNEQAIHIGEQAYLFQTSDDCGSGFILIAIRSNVISITIGCGENINIALMEKIGLIIDNHITSGSNAIKLTPEEMSVAGYHDYLGKGTMLNDSPCGFGNSINNKTEEIQWSETFDFLGNGILILGNYQDVDVIFFRTGVNAYTGFLNREDYAHQQITINITMNGFTELNIYVGGLCNALHEYTKIE